MKKLLLLITAGITIASIPLSAYASEPIKVTIDGKSINFDVEPQIINNRTMVPMRAIFEELGATVEYVPAEKTERQKGFVYAKKGDTAIGLFIDDNNLFFYDTSDNSIEETIKIDTPAIVKNGRTLVPVRVVSESLDCTVKWDDKTKTVTINSNNISNENTASSSNNENTASSTNTDNNNNKETSSAEINEDTSSKNEDSYIFSMTDEEINKAKLSGTCKPSEYNNKYSKYYIKPTTYDELGSLLSKSSKLFVGTPKSAIAHDAQVFTDPDTFQSGFTFEEAKEFYNIFEENKYCAFFFDIAYPDFEKDVDISIKIYQDGKEIPADINTDVFNEWSEDNYIYAWDDLQGWTHGLRYKVGYKFSPTAFISLNDFDVTKDIDIEVLYNQKDMFEETDYKAKAKTIFNKGPIKLKYTVNVSDFE